MPTDNDREQLTVGARAMPSTAHPANATEIDERVNPGRSDRRCPDLFIYSRSHYPPPNLAEMTERAACGPLPICVPTCSR
ncbi:unnamed protein product, partial [Iphiclides podalirius]